MRACLVALAVALVGCGADDPPVASTPTAVAEATPVQPRIESPRNGDVVPSTASLGDTRGASITVTGTAEPETKVIIASGCGLPTCRRTVTASTAGEFKGEVSASTLQADEPVTITAAYELSTSTASDRVIVVLGEEAAEEATRTPRPSRTRERKRPRRPAKTATPRPTTAPPQATATPEPPPTGGGTGPVVVIGDSLAEGMRPFLASALQGRSVRVDARIGRPLAEGMRLFAAESVRPGTVYAFSLFTNDDPGAVAALTNAVGDSVQRGGCAVWATIVRPPLNGVSYDAANRQLKALQSSYGNRLQLVDWAAAVSANPSWLAGDGVHATPEGYRNRAALYAQAISRC